MMCREQDYSCPLRTRNRADFEKGTATKGETEAQSEERPRKQITTLKRQSRNQTSLWQDQ